LKSKLLNFCAFLILIFVSGMHVSFADTTAPLAASKPPTKGAERIKLTAWYYQTQWLKSLDYYKTKLTEFQKTHPNVDIEFVYIPYAGYETKYLTAFAGRTNSPDLFLGKVAYYAGAVGVSDVAPDDLQKRWSDSVLDVVQHFYKVGGKWYGYPVSCDVGLELYYNTDMFKEAGLDPAKPPKTMAELEEYAKKLTKYDLAGKITQSGYAQRYSGAPAGIADKTLPFIHAFGGRLYSTDGKTATGFLDSPETIDGVTFLQKLIQTDKVANLELGAPEVQFAAGKAAMVMRESFLVGYLKTKAPNIKYAVAPMPTGPKGYPGLSLLFSHAWNVNKFGQNKDMAWEWLRFVSNEQMDADLAQLEGYMPVWKANWKKDFVTQSADFNAASYIISQPNGPYYDHPYINEVSNAAGAAMQAIIMGKDVKETLGKAAADINKILVEK
jgi:ABC-type glycerol-3-phosphate transport system substrate-binding protein